MYLEVVVTRNTNKGWSVLKGEYNNIVIGQYVP